MEEEILMYLDDAKEQMGKAVQHTNKELGKIKAGKASPSMLDGVKVLYYGAETPLNQVATVNTPDARTLSIRPFEKNLIGDIEKAIINSDLGFNPQNNGESIMINIPILTEERRKELVKQVKTEIENGKVRVRNIRKDTNNGLKDLQKDGASEDAIKKAEEDVQKLTDAHIAQIEEIFVSKEKELMTV